jgi:hypothetical protein
MVSLHLVHSATNNEKYSQNSNEACLVNEMKNGLYPKLGFKDLVYNNVELHGANY